MLRSLVGSEMCIRDRSMVTKCDRIVAEWQELARRWATSHEPVLRHLYMMLVPTNVPLDTHQHFSLYPDPDNMQETVEIASRKNPWQVLPGYPYKNDGISVIVHQNKLKRKFSTI
eukprot:TRINITY_DN43725_c0_g1_i1.p1 TRINITY_DN43725_c0_g1~~TRINITY_DN43725_c0_g1_i1.p1  ORF type:complete len:115 (-),score=24.07 TRINITY_DN43725_c0_g1_i1:317-661(-)